MNTDNLGALFERYICDLFGYKLSTDKAWQIRYGDTSCRTEIKYDRLLHKTGNIYIEGWERRKGNNGDYIKAGPFKECRIYLIGDCSRVLMLRPEVARSLYIKAETTQPHLMKVSPTSKGSIIPYKYAEYLSARQYRLGKPPLYCESNVI